MPSQFSRQGFGCSHANVRGSTLPRSNLLGSRFWFLNGLWSKLLNPPTLRTSHADSCNPLASWGPAALPVASWTLEASGPSFGQGPSLDTRIVWLWVCLKILNSGTQKMIGVLRVSLSTLKRPQSKVLGPVHETNPAQGLVAT